MKLSEVQLDELVRRLSLIAGGSMPVLALANDPTVTPTLSQLGQLGLWAGVLYMHVTGATDTQWVNVTDLLGAQGRLVRRFGATLNFGDFSDPGTVKTVRIAPDLPAGSLIVAANAGPVIFFDAPGLATLTLEFDDNTGGSAGVIVPFNVVAALAVLPTARNIGNAANGRPIQYFTCTARATGANLNALTAGQVHFEAMYVIP